MYLRWYLNFKSYESQDKRICNLIFYSFVVTMKLIAKNKVYIKKKAISMVNFDKTKPHINIGTIGHVGHGKTTLSTAITKVLALKGDAESVDYEKINHPFEERVGDVIINAAHI